MFQMFKKDKFYRTTWLKDQKQFISISAHVGLPIQQVSLITHVIYLIILSVEDLYCNMNFQIQTLSLPYAPAFQTFYILVVTG